MVDGIFQQHCLSLRPRCRGLRFRQRLPGQLQDMRDPGLLPAGKRGAKCRAERGSRSGETNGAFRLRLSSGQTHETFQQASDTAFVP
jgi:hypothetical protein